MITGKGSPLTPDNRPDVAAYDAEQVEWLLGEARSIIHNLANEVAEGFVFDKDEPPQLRKAREVVAEIDDMLGVEQVPS